MVKQHSICFFLIFIVTIIGGVVGELKVLNNKNGIFITGRTFIVNNKVLCNHFVFAFNTTILDNKLFYTYDNDADLEHQFYTLKNGNETNPTFILAQTKGNETNIVMSVVTDDGNRVNFNFPQFNQHDCLNGALDNDGKLIESFDTIETELQSIVIDQEKAKNKDPEMLNKIARSYELMMTVTSYLNIYTDIHPKKYLDIVYQQLLNIPIVFCQDALSSLEVLNGYKLTSIKEVDAKLFQDYLNATSHIKSTYTDQCIRMVDYSKLIANQFSYAYINVLNGIAMKPDELSYYFLEALKLFGNIVNSAGDLITTEFDLNHGVSMTKVKNDVNIGIAASIARKIKGFESKYSVAALLPFSESQDRYFSVHIAKPLLNDYFPEYFECQIFNQSGMQIQNALVIAEEPYAKHYVTCNLFIEWNMNPLNSNTDRPIQFVTITHAGNSLSRNTLYILIAIAIFLFCVIPFCSCFWCLCSDYCTKCCIKKRENRRPNQYSPI